jgi:hypothetical protein
MAAPFHPGCSMPAHASTGSFRARTADVGPCRSISELFQFDINVACDGDPESSPDRAHFGGDRTVATNPCGAPTASTFLSPG